MKSPLSRHQRARIRLSYLRELSRFENALQRKLTKLIKKQGETLAWYYRNTHTISKHHLIEHHEELKALLIEYHKRVARTFSEKISRGLKASTFDAALDAWIKARALSTINDIDDYTLRIIRNVIRNGVESGVDENAIADLIEEATNTVNGKARARVIARTEMHTAMGFAQEEAAKATGLRLVKTWTSTQDGRTRDAHRIADGQTVPVDDNFIVGGESISRPGDGSAANAVNCRCVAIYSEAPPEAE